MVGTLKWPYGYLYFWCMLEWERKWRAAMPVYHFFPLTIFPVCLIYSSLSSHKQLWKSLLFLPLPLKFIFSSPLPLTVSFPFLSSLHLFSLSYPSIFSFFLALWLRVTICFWTFAGNGHQHIASLSLNLICNFHEFSCHPLKHKLLYASNIQCL